jgi:hypothetical protein
MAPRADWPPTSARHRAWDRARLAGHRMEQADDPDERLAHAGELLGAVKELEEWHRGPLYVGTVTMSQGQMSIVYDLVRIAYARKAETDADEPGWVKLRDAEAGYARTTAGELRELLLTLGENWSRLGLE